MFQEKLQLRGKLTKIGLISHLARALIYFISTTLGKILSTSQGHCHAAGEIKITN